MDGAYLSLIAIAIASVALVRTMGDHRAPSPRRFIIRQDPIVHPIVQPPPTPIVHVAYDRNTSSGPPETYRQVGYLTRDTGEMLALYGKISTARRSRWFYYAIVRDIKVPVFSDGRDCMREVGCDEVYDGSQVIIPDYDPGVTWKVKVYGNEMRI